MCPTYYSDDPILDRAFGQRPDRYLRDLGAMLHPAIEMFWTGERVCSDEISPQHLQRVTEEIGRKPFLWDNYPVNDGSRMSKYLHVRGFSNRPATLRNHLAAHAINPAAQPTLTRIPALTLIDSYERGNQYDRTAAELRAAQEALGGRLGRMVHEDARLLHDVGLDELGDERQRLRDRYSRVDHPGAREVMAWLDGAYRVTDEDVHTQ